MKTTKKLTENHDAFWALLAKGSTLIAACEAVGVDRAVDVPIAVPRTGQGRSTT